MAKVPADELHKIAERAAEEDVKTKVTAKRYLQSILRMENTIERKKEELEKLREDAVGLGSLKYDAIKVQTSTNGDKMAGDVSRYVDLEKEIVKETDRLVQARHIIINQIANIEPEEYATLLYKRYVEGKRLELISVEMNFTYEYTRRMHGRALQAFERSYTKLHLPVVL